MFEKIGVGEWKIWHDNGKLAYGFHYNKGQKTGVWKAYNRNGVLINVREY